MNVIVNFIEIKNDSDFENYLISVEHKTLFENIINQTKITEDDLVTIMINSKFEGRVKKTIERFEQKININIKTPNNDQEFLLMEKLKFDDLVETFRTFRTCDLHGFLGNMINYQESTLLMDGSKLYKKNTLNFMQCNSDTLVQFKEKGSKNSYPYMYFFFDSVKDQVSEIKSVYIKDYKYNFINMLDIKSIIEANTLFSHNKKLYVKYMKQVFNKCEFSDIFEGLSDIATRDNYWALQYFQILIDFGWSVEAYYFYINNKQLFDEINLTIAQNQIYQDTLKVIELIETGQALTFSDIDDFIDNGYLDFEYIISLIKKSKTKQQNTSYLINKLVETNQLTVEYASILLDFVRLNNLNPAAQKKNVIDIFDYFIAENRILNVPQKFLNQMVTALHTNEHLFDTGIDNRMRKLKEKLKLTIKLDTDIQLNQDILELPIPDDKVAVCITGMAKLNFEKNLENIQHFIGTDLNVDYFVQIWDTFESYPEVGRFGRNSDRKWANLYFKKINNSLPKIIERQANFEALLPNTARLLFGNKYEKFDGKEYERILGSNIKVIKKYDYKMFIERFQLDDNVYSDLNQKIQKYLERNLVQNMVEKHCKKSGRRYKYLITIDINTVFKTKLTYKEIEKIKLNEINIVKDSDNALGDGLNITRFETGLKINKLCDLFQSTKSASPYLMDEHEIKDEHQNPLLMHLIYNNIKIRTIGDRLGSVYISRKIMTPNTSEVLNLDLQSLEGDVAPYVRYFENLDENFACPIKNSEKYKFVDKVSLIESKVTDTGISLELSIKGNNLTKIYKPNLQILANSIINYNCDCSNAKSYRHPFDILKYEANEVVVKHEITDKDLLNGKTWSVAFLLNEYTPKRVEIEYEACENTYELCKYGMKFIDFTDGLKVGIDTKMFLLDGMKV
ncbi:MAG: hypothetical protein ACK5NF_02720 [Bacilli bacterium]